MLSIIIIEKRWSTPYVGRDPAPAPDSWKTHSYVQPVPSSYKSTLIGTNIRHGSHRNRAEFNFDGKNHKFLKKGVHRVRIYGCFTVSVFICSWAGTSVNWLRFNLMIRPCRNILSCLKIYGLLWCFSGCAIFSLPLRQYRIIFRIYQMK